MFTLYQMAANGDGNLSGLTNPTFMSAYWSNVRLLFQQIKLFGKPVLVNFEPDFWDYTQRASTNSDPSTVTAIVNSNTDCANLPNNVTGVAQCLLLTARTYAPNAYVGFPPALASDLYPASVAFMQNLVRQMPILSSCKPSTAMPVALRLFHKCHIAHAPGQVGTGMKPISKRPISHKIWRREAISTLACSCHCCGGKPH